MNPTKEIEVIPFQVGREQYLARLSDLDRTNMIRIAELFTAAGKKLGREGLLLVVGGTINKPLPRKDIDLVAVLQKNTDDPKREDYGTYYDFALAEFRNFQQLLETMVSQDSKFKIGEVQEPVIDEEYQSPSILKNDGSITITDSTGGTKMEFIRREMKNSIRDSLSEETRPFVVLASVASLETSGVQK